MPERKFNNWLDAYLRYAEHSEAPDVFHFWTGISVLAGALRRRVWIDQKYFQWTPNFYIIFVAPPGIVSKTTTASIGMNLLRELDYIHFGPDVITWQALIQSMADSMDQMQIGDDYYMMSCITISSSEFGTFLNPNDREMVDVLTSLWDGQVGAWKKATKTQGSDIIQNPWINVLACTTPAWIAGNMPEYVIGGGFMSRCIIVYAEEKRKLVAYPAEHVTEDFEQLRLDLIHDLEIISMMCGEYSLSKEAHDWGVAWYENHYTTIKEKVASTQIQGYMARKQTHMHKLAMVLSAATHDDLEIRLPELQKAHYLVTGLEPNMEKIFSTIAATEETQKASELITVVERYGRIPQQRLFRLLFNKMSFADFKGALESAINAGHVQAKSNGTQVMIHYLRQKDE